MSGDNMYGKQPLKFYSEHLTITKITLIDHLLKETYKYNKSITLEENLNDLEKLLTN